MSSWISILNGGAVSIFGSLLSASFCNVLDTKRTRRIFSCCMVLILLFQSGMCFACTGELLQRIYPLIMHVPLLLVLYFLTGKMLWPLIAILTAYLCCQLRRWLALLVVGLLSGGMVMQDTVEFIITFPMLVLLIYFISPGIQQQSRYPAKLQCQFGVVPALYYVFDYLTRVYTDFLYSGSPVVVEFMPFVCCALYLVFLLYNSAEERERNRMEQVQRSLDIQLTQAVQEINALRQSQQLARQYRHDLRHHLQYVSACIENGQDDLAQGYIMGICKEVEAQAVQHFCENEAVNLILSAFVGRAKKSGVDMNVKGELSSFIMVSDSDLCVLFSNALENALHACQALTAEGKACSIDVQFYEREGRFYLQVINPCRDDIRFEKGIPVSKHPGHGIGVQSICGIVERHKGMYNFLVQNGHFILRLSI